MRRPRSNSASRKPWWFASLFNHYVLPVLAGLTIAIILTCRSSGTVPSPEPQQEEIARQQREISVLLTRLRERDERVAKLEREREEERRLERERKRDAENQERERWRQEKERSEREQRDTEAVRREIAELREMLKSQAEKIAADAILVRSAANATGKPNAQAAKGGDGEEKPPSFEPVKVIAAARAEKAAADETKAFQILEGALRMLTSDNGSVRRARWAWHSVIEHFPETDAARLAKKFLADTREILIAENEKDASVALKSANSAYYSGGFALARLRYRNIMEDYPTTQAAKEARKMFSILR